MSTSSTPTPANRATRTARLALAARRSVLRCACSAFAISAHPPPDAQEANSGPHVLLLVRRQVAHDAAPIQNFGSIPSSWIE
jgi:hypothetical protein